MTDNDPNGDARLQFIARVAVRSRAPLRSDDLPDWFREHYCGEPDGETEIERLLRESGLPTEAQQDLLGLTWSFHLFLEESPALQPKKIKAEIKALRSQLAKLKSTIDGLSLETIDVLRGEPIHEVDPETGGFIDFGPNPLLGIRSELESFLSRPEVEVKGGNAGRKVSSHRHALHCLRIITDRHMLSMKNDKFLELAHALFDPVMSHHGQNSRVDPDLTPRLRDAVSRERQDNKTSRARGVRRTIGRRKS